MAGEIVPSNPDVGVNVNYTAQSEYGALGNRQLHAHIFPANKTAWHRYRGPLPQLGSVLQIIKPPVV